MNDSTELFVGLEAWDRGVRTDMLAAEDRPVALAVRQAMEFELGMRSVFMVSCFTRETDSLIHWSYADDGRGVSLGFDGTRLAGKSVIFEMSYDEQEHIEEVMSVFNEEVKLLKYESGMSVQNIIEDREAVVHIATLLLRELTALKNPGYMEEREVRWMQLAQRILERPPRRLIYGGVTRNGKQLSEAQPVGFWTKGGRVSPYIDVPWLKPDGSYDDVVVEAASSPLREVHLGPNNPSSVRDVCDFLHTVGLPWVKVTQGGKAYKCF